MSSIVLPARYRFPDILANLTARTNNKLKYCPRNLAFIGMDVKHGVAYWRRRFRNSFLQIYSVQFLNPDPEERDLIRGKIIVNEKNMFVRQMDAKAPHHDIDAHGFARLTGPMDPFDAEYYIGLSTRMFRKNRPYDFFHPQSCIKFDKQGWTTVVGVAIPPLDLSGYHAFSLCEENTYRHDKLFSDEIETVCDPVKVTYASFRDAADSFMTVKLVKWNREGGDKMANVYGKICMSDTLFGGDDHAKSVVFDLRRDECVSIKPDEYIHMRKPVTVVPMGYELKVEVNLFHRNMGSGDDDNEDVVIASGTCLFTAKNMDRDLPVLKWGFEDTTDAEDEDTTDEQEEEGEEEEEEEEEDEEEEYDDDYDKLCIWDLWTTDDESLLEISELKTISGRWGEIQIKVYWQPGWYHNRHYGG